MYFQNRKKLSLYTLILFIFLLAFSLNIFNITSFNDGVEYLFISENLLNNFSLNEKIETSEYQKYFHSPQLGSTFILVLLKILTKKYYFIIYFLILSFLWLNLIISIKNYYVFKNFSKIFLYAFIFLIFFQFNVLRTSTSFYNEGIYYPIFLTTLISLDNLIQKKIKLNLTNKVIVYFFFATGPFFQLIHFFILSTFFIILIYNIYKKNIKFNDYFLFFTISILSSIIYIYFYSLISNNHEITNINTNNIISNISNFSLNFQKFFNIFITPFNLHLFFKDFTIVQNTKLNYSYELIFLCLVLCFIFVFSLKKLYELNNFYLFTIIFIPLSFLAKVIITDYDVRYNIYSNFFVLFYILMILEKTKKKNLVKIIFLTFIISIIYKSSILFTLNNNFYTNMNYNVKNIRTINNLRLLKSIKEELNQKKIIKYDMIISSFNSRYIYQVFKKQNCHVKNINKCFKNNSKNILLIISDNEKKKLVLLDYDFNFEEFIYVQ